MLLFPSTHATYIGHYWPSSGTEYMIFKTQNIMQTYKGKRRVLPRIGHEGAEGEQIYSSTLPSASALDGGGWSTPRPGRFTPCKDPVPVL